MTARPSLLVLIAEDELLVADLLNNALCDAGYDVVMAHDGAAALDEVERGVGRFRAIATDIQLGGGPDGWQVAERARELAPAMPVIYMSGASAEDWASKGVPGSVMIAKPFAPAQLTTAVANLVTQADMRTP